MRSLAHFLRSLNLNLNSSFSDRELLASVCLVSSQRRTRKLKKRYISLLCKTLFSSGGIQKHKTAYGVRNKRNQIYDKARLFMGSILRTKHQSLTSLALMRLVPGADRVVSNICIRCIGFWLCKTFASRKY